MSYPQSLNILGKEYSIVYLDRPADVDPSGQSVLWGHVDYWSRSIRIYHGHTADVWHSLLHEILHAIAEDLSLPALSKEKHHAELDQLALALADLLLRNELLAQGVE